MSRVALESRPLLRWAGSKRRTVSRYAAMFPTDAELYVEPFAGSAALFFARRPRRAVLSDINGDLIDTYRQVRNHPEEVYRYYRRRKIEEAAYYRARDAFNYQSSGTQRAALFLYLNRACFNGLFRTNNAGFFNVPFGGQRVPPSLDHRDIESAARLLRRAKLRSQDFAETIDEFAAPGAFFYIDPPYFVSDRRVFREYGAAHFSAKDLRRLRSALKLIHDRGAKFLVSYADSDEAKLLGKGWNNSQIEVLRHISGFADSRRSDVELIVSNYDAAVH